MQLSMSEFDGRRVGKGLVSDALLDTPGNTGVRLQTPLPLWASATFPENAKFNLHVSQYTPVPRWKDAQNHLHNYTFDALFFGLYSAGL